MGKSFSDELLVPEGTAKIVFMEYPDVSGDHKGQVVNPVNYYFMDLSAEDYDRMIQIAANHGKVLD